MNSPWSQRPGPASPHEAEIVLLQDTMVTVTRALVRVRSSSYPIASIGSVGVISPDRSKAITFAGIAGLVAAATWGTPVAVIAGIIAVVAAVGAWNRPHILVLRTGSGDQQVLTSRKADYLNTVKAAVEAAVVQRG